MSDLLELIETIEQENADVRQRFTATRDEGQRAAGRFSDADLAEAARFLKRLYEGRVKRYVFEEAMTRSDFPLMFADILDRQLLGSYQETPATWRAYARQGSVPDLRDVKRFAVDGAESVLPSVKERSEYKEAALSEKADTYAVSKYGRRIDLSWEMMINDDLDAFRNLPQRLARAARRTEAKFATGLFVGPNGPHNSLYNGTNTVSGNPALDIEALQEAFGMLGDMVDADGEPIVLDMVNLVVPPSLEITARNILNATEIELRTAGGSDDQRLRANNWMKNRVQLSVEPYIPHVAKNANGKTSWFLFAEPSTGRPALEIGFLRGEEEPALYERAPDARRIGGGEVPESFVDDSRAWRVRHVVGGTRLTNTGGRKATIASNGSGSAS